MVPVLPGSRIAHGGLDAPLVAGIDARDEELGRQALFLARHPQKLANPLVGEDFLPGGVPPPHAHGRGVERDASAFLRPAELLVVAPAPRDVEEGDHQPIDYAALVEIGKHAARQPAAVPRPHFLLDRLGTVADRPEVRQGWRIDEHMGEMRERAPDILGDQVIDLGRGRRETADRAMPVEEDRPDADRAQMIVEIRIGRRQRLVRGLGVFLGGLELLVRRLQLLVHREQFFIRRLQFFIRRLEILNRPVEILARPQKLLLEMLDHAIRIRPAARLIGARRGRAESLENQHVEALFKAELWHGLNGQPYPFRAFRGVHGDLAHRHPPVAQGLGKRRPQANSEASTRHALDVVGKGARGRLDIALHAFREEGDLPFLVDDGVAGRELVEDNALGERSEVRARPCIGITKAWHAAPSRSMDLSGRSQHRLLALHETMVTIDVAEQVAVAADAFGRAEEEVAAPAQRIVEERNELLL